MLQETRRLGGGSRLESEFCSLHMEDIKAARHKTIAKPSHGRVTTCLTIRNRELLGYDAANCSDGGRENRMRVELPKKIQTVETNVLLLRP